MTTLKELESKLASIEKELGNAQEAERRMAVELVTRSKELADCEKERDKYRKQVQLGFKHIVETPVLTDAEIEEGYTVVEHLRKVLSKALKERDDARNQCVKCGLMDAAKGQLASEQATNARLREVIHAYVNAGFGAATDLDKQAAAYRLAIDSVRQGHVTTALDQYVAGVLRELHWVCDKNSLGCAGFDVLRRKAEELTK